MLNKTLPDVAVGRIFDNVSDVIQRACSPVATVGAQGVSNCRVAVGIKAQRFVGPQGSAWQRHVDGGRVSLRCAQCTLQTLGILLRKDRLLIHFIIDGVGKEVATSHEVCGALNGAVADNGNLCGASRCRHQGDRTSAVRCNGHCVVGGQRQQRVVLVDRNVSVRQNLKGERIRASATGCVYNSTGYV